MSLELNTIESITIALLFFMALFALFIALVLANKIKRTDKKAVDQFIVSHLGFSNEGEERFAKMVKLELLLRLIAIGSICIAAFALINAFLYRGHQDSSISIAFFWSSGLLLFASVYCSALWLLVKSVLKKWTDTI
jgi:hypothetical protein